MNAKSNAIRTLFLAWASLLLALLSAASKSPTQAAQTTAPSFKRVFIVMFENTGYSAAIKQPTFKKIATNGALLTNLWAENHPSQGNYIALVAGDTYGVATDSTVNLDVSHIGDLLEAKGLSWKIYLEGYPGACFKGSGSGMYERKHNPFISFKNIQNDLVRCLLHVVNAKEMLTNLQLGTLPDFALYVPDDNHNGHDTGVAYADQWLKQFFGPLLLDPRFMQDTVFIPTFDEGSGSNHIYTALYGDSVAAGSSSSLLYSHYSILRTIEDAWGLGTLNRKDSKAAAIAGVWK